MSLLEELVKSGLIQESQIEEIKNRAIDKHDGDIDDALSEMNVQEDKVLDVKGRYFSMPTKKLGPKDISFDALKYISEDSATHYHFVPIALNDGVLEVGVLNPDNAEGMDALQFISSKIGIPFKLFLISKSDYKRITDSYRGISTQVEQAIDEYNKDDTGEKEVEKQAECLDNDLKNTKPGDTKIVEDAPIIKIVAVILRSAVESLASDIHIENSGDKVKVRFRIDGVLHTSLVLPISVYNGVIARVKILSKLTVDPTSSGKDSNLRVSPSSTRYCLPPLKITAYISKHSNASIYYGYTKRGGNYILLTS